MKTMPHVAALRVALALCVAASLAGCKTGETLGHDHAALGIEHVCSSCHGMEGRTDNPAFPNLAGQQEAYLIAQLKAFRDHKRADPHARTYMFGMAATLDDATIGQLASFYAAQIPASAASADPAEIAAGGPIFKNGIASEHVPACLACHGAHAEGRAVIPRLADQHAVYLRDQLAAFRINSRANIIMHANAQHMTDGQIDAVAAYLASL